eukprot:9830102-Lingulodinium_polyedra.AAC.1
MGPPWRRARRRSERRPRRPPREQRPGWGRGRGRRNASSRACPAPRGRKAAESNVWHARRPRRQ